MFQAVGTISRNWARKDKVTCALFGWFGIAFVSVDVPRFLIINGTATPSIMASPPPGPPPHKHSCLLCARRKIKCDKQDPRCSNCTKSRADCIYQAPPPPQRHKKRQADEELIARLNQYEELLRSHKIDFKPSTTVLTPKSIPDDQPKTSPRQHSNNTLDTNPPSSGRSGYGTDHSTHSDSVGVESRNHWALLSSEVFVQFLQCSRDD
jgi:Fungal Zn(2)-Cys(6) binuclear cluster domain